jgi:1-deoxy-D-xylulose-5-phosphate synthase
MVRMGTRDQKIVAVTAAMEYGTGLAEFARLFPKRFIDVGIAEQHGVVFAAGLAREGYKPVVAIYSTFMQRGYDHLVHDVCMQEYPVVFAMDRAGIVGEDGPTHHGVFDIAFCRHIPNLVMMAPSDENELLDMMATALSMGRPCVIRYPRAHGLGVTLRKDPQTLPLKARALVTGNDLVIIAIGSMVAPAVEASRILHQEGLSVGVIDARFIKPLDKELILSTVSRIRSVLTVEEGILAGGFGSSLLELFADSGLENVKVVRMGVPDRFIEHGTREELLEEIGLTPTHIAEQCRIMIKSPATPKHLRINVGS